MGNLLIIVGVLFIALFIVVKLTEKYARPVDQQQQAKMSRLAMVLMLLVMVMALIRHYMTG